MVARSGWVWLIRPDPPLQHWRSRQLDGIRRYDMPVRDTNLMLPLASAGNLTASAALTAKEINGTFANGMALQVNCPTAFTGTGPNLTISIFGSTRSEE